MNELQWKQGGVTFARGFTAAGVHCEMCIRDSPKTVASLAIQRQYFHQTYGSESVFTPQCDAVLCENWCLVVFEYYLVRLNLRHVYERENHV